MWSKCYEITGFNIKKQNCVENKKKYNMEVVFGNSFSFYTIYNKYPTISIGIFWKILHSTKEKTFRE